MYFVLRQIISVTEYLFKAKLMTQQLYNVLELCQCLFKISFNANYTSNLLYNLFSSRKLSSHTLRSSCVGKLWRYYKSTYYGYIVADGIF